MFNFTHYTKIFGCSTTQLFTIPFPCQLLLLVVKEVVKIMQKIVSARQLQANIKLLGKMFWGFWGWCSSTYWKKIGSNKASPSEACSWLAKKMCCIPK